MMGADMSGTELGVILAISTAFSWALAGVVHTSASRVAGIRTVMLVRQPLATAASVPGSLIACAGAAILLLR